MRTEAGHESVVLAGERSSFIWKLVTTLALSCALFAIYDNTQRVERIEEQVCNVLEGARAAIPKTSFYKNNPDEREKALRRSDRALQEFGCPVPGSPIVPEALR